MGGYTLVCVMCDNSAMCMYMNDIQGGRFSEVGPQVALQDEIEKTAQKQGSRKQ